MNSKGTPQIWRFDNANALYYALVDAVGASVREVIEAKPNPVLALPTGNTMIPFYKIAVDQEDELAISQWHCFNLDEYYPTKGRNDRLSFKNYMNTFFYSRLKNVPAAYEILNGCTNDPETECAEYERKIKAVGGLDIAILGIGANGHIAFNEPGSEFNSRTRLVDLHPQTLMANFKGTAPLTQAMTLGIGTLLEAKKIYVVAIGKGKAQAVKSAMKEVPSRTIPASGLQAHSNVTWFLDQEAASFI